MSYKKKSRIGFSLNTRQHAPLVYFDGLLICSMFRMFAGVHQSFGGFEEKGCIQESPVCFLVVHMFFDVHTCHVSLDARAYTQADDTEDTVPTTQAAHHAHIVVAQNIAIV